MTQPFTGTIRQASQEDGEAIRDFIFDILEEYGLSGTPREMDADLAEIDAHYTNRGGTFEILESPEGLLFGTLGMYPRSEDVCELRKMYLHPNWRGKGIGTWLLERAITRAKELGFVTIELETASVLKRAISLYTNRGFKPIENTNRASRCDQAYTLTLTSR